MTQSVKTANLAAHVGMPRETIYFGQFSFCKGSQSTH